MTDDLDNILDIVLAFCTVFLIAICALYYIVFPS